MKRLDQLRQKPPLLLWGRGGGVKVLTKVNRNQRSLSKQLLKSFPLLSHATHTSLTLRPASQLQPHIYLCMPDAHQTQSPAFGLDCSAVPILAPTVCLCLPGFHLTYFDPLRCLSFLTGVSQTHFPASPIPCLTQLTVSS